MTQRGKTRVTTAELCEKCRRVHLDYVRKKKRRVKNKKTYIGKVAEI
jgi:hypothetical protein